METITHAKGHARMDSLIQEDYTPADISPISTISFNHALHQLESDLGLVRTRSSEGSPSFPIVEDGRPGPYGPVVSSPALSSARWQPPDTMAMRYPPARRQTAPAPDVAPLAYKTSRPCMSPSRLSIDGSNIEIVSDHTRAMESQRNSIASSEQSPTLAGNMSGLRRSKRANYNRQAPRRLQQRRNSVQSMSPLSDSTPTTPELPFRPLSPPLKSSPQQLPQLIIPNRRKKSSAADDRGLETPPPVPAYSLNRPRRTPSRSGYDSASVSPKSPSAEWAPPATAPMASHMAMPILQPISDRSIGSMLQIKIPDTPLDRLVQPINRQLQAIQETDPNEDSPTLPRTHSLPEPTKTPISPPTKRQTIFTFPDTDTLLEPYIVSPSPAEDRFFTISDYNTDNSPHPISSKYYPALIADNARSKSVPNAFVGMNDHHLESFLHDDESLSSGDSDSECDFDAEPQRAGSVDESMGLRDYVQQILRRSASQRQSTSSWRKRVGSSFLMSDSDPADSTAHPSNRVSSDTLSIAGSSTSSVSDGHRRHSSSGSSISSSSSVSALRSEDDDIHEHKHEDVEDEDVSCTDISLVVSDAGSMTTEAGGLRSTSSNSMHDSTIGSLDEPEMPAPLVVANKPSLITPPSAPASTPPSLPAAPITTPPTAPKAVPAPPPTTASSTSSSISSSAAADQTDTQCRICGDLFPLHRYHSKPTLLCRHDAEACRPCLSRWITAKMAQRAAGLRNSAIVPASLAAASSPTTATANARTGAGAGMAPLGSKGEIKCPVFGCGQMLTAEDEIAVREMRTKAC